MANKQQSYDQLQSSLAHFPAEIQQQIWEETIPHRCLELSMIQWRNAPGGKQRGTMVIREPHLGPCAFKVCLQTRTFLSTKGISLTITDAYNANKWLWFYPERDILTIDADTMAHLLTDDDVSVDGFEHIHNLGLVWREISEFPSSLESRRLDEVPRLWFLNLLRLKELMPSLETINFFVPESFAERWNDPSQSCTPEPEYYKQFPSVITPLKDWMELELWTEDVDGEQLYDALLKTDDEEHTRQLSWETIRDRLSELAASAASKFGSGSSARDVTTLKYRAWSRKRVTE